MNNMNDSQDLKKRLYYRLLLLRRLEERIIADYPAKEMRSPSHLYMGHEAIAVGVCEALDKDDIVYPYYRSHGWYLAKGGDLKAMVAELHGRENGCSKGWGGSMHLIELKAGVMGTSAIVAGTVSHAAGAALAFCLQGKKSVCAVSFGDGAVEEGVFHETLNMAALRKLPVLFICENNLYATNTHIRYRQAQTEIFRRAESYGIPGVRIDGNDVLAVYEEAQRAVRRARKGEGPTLIECMTYRYLEHCGVNGDLYLGYRTEEEVKEWHARDPLLKAACFLSEKEKSQMDTEIKAAIDAAFLYAKASPFPQALVTEGGKS
jgi:TPP-dependent pyruvate/acetoin dehydrogenase alpha subunit